MGRRLLYTFSARNSIAGGASQRCGGPGVSSGGVTLKRAAVAYRVPASSPAYSSPEQTSTFRSPLPLQRTQMRKHIASRSPRLAPDVRTVGRTETIHILVVDEGGAGIYISSFILCEVRKNRSEAKKYIKNLLNSCLRFLRCLQFESATLRGPLMSDASQLLPLV